MKRKNLYDMSIEELINLMHYFGLKIKGGKYDMIETLEAHYRFIEICNNAELIKKDKYFADYDEETESYCVFHTDYKTGHAFSSWASMAQAERDAEQRNNK